MKTARRRLLLVEDDAAARDAFVDLLTLSGYDVHAANDAAAVEFALSWSPEIAVVDLGPPDRNGTDLVSGLVSQGIHVVAFSGWHHLRAGAVAAGAHAFVLKPNIGELLRVLARLEHGVLKRKQRSRGGR